MNRTKKVAACVFALVALVAVAPQAHAKAPQIEDPEGDHPVPFMDFTEVRLALGRTKAGPALETTFVLAGAITPESRATMTGYSFTAKVGSCDLLVRFVGYPDGGAFDAAGFASTMCGGRDVGGTWRITDNTVTVISPLRDLKGVGVGQTMTDLAAFSSPAEGMYHDDTTAPSALGDAASSDKPWTIA